MVLIAFPLAKLGFLLLKQLSKPIASAIKNRAKSHPFFRKYVCIPPARAYHWCEMQVKLHVRGRWKPVTVVPITEEEAVELGASLLGELVLFTMLSGILISEIGRQGDKKAEKEKLKEDELLNLIDTVINIVHEVEDLKESIKEIQSSVGMTHHYDLAELEELKSHLLATETERQTEKTAQDSSPSL